SKVFQQALVHVKDTGAPNAKGPSQQHAGILSRLAYAHGRAHHQREAVAILDTLKRAWDARAITPMPLAKAYLGIGDENSALHVLEQGLAEHHFPKTPGNVWYTDPGYEVLQTNPR